MYVTCEQVPNLLKFDIPAISNLPVAGSTVMGWIKGAVNAQIKTRWPKIVEDEIEPKIEEKVKVRGVLRAV